MSEKIKPPVNAKRQATIMIRILRVAAHAVLFITAFLLFFLGIGVGLSLNPLLGMTLWAVAALITGGNIWWMLHRSSAKNRKDEK